jgi:hypothetical protein
MERRYQALHILSTVYKVLGAIAAGLTVLLILGICAAAVLSGSAVRSFGRDVGLPMISGIFGGLLGIVFALIYGGGIAITLYAMGEGINLLLDMEANTRETAALLRDKSSPPPPPPPE